MAKLIEIEVGGATATARLLEDAAPRTVQRFWEALPIQGRLRHMRWGGSAAYILEPSLRDPAFPIENRVAFYHPATICLKPIHGELAFSYGQAQARSLQGNDWASHFATIEGDSAAFLQVLERTQREGGKPIVIRRKEG